MSEKRRMRRRLTRSGIAGVAALMIAATAGASAFDFFDGGAYSAGTYPYRVVAAEMNRGRGGGVEELAVADFQAHVSQFYILRRMPNGGFKTINAPIGDLGNQAGLVAARLDDGPDPDLAISRLGGGMVQVMLATNTRGVAFEQPVAYDVSGYDPRGLTAGDFTGDGIPDLAVAMQNVDHLSFLRGTGDGQFGKSRKVDVGGSFTEIAAAHLDGDRHLDLVLGNGQSSAAQAVVLWGKGHGHFSAAKVIAKGRYRSSIDVADLDADGHPDVLLGDDEGDPHDGTISIVWGRGERQFTDPRTYPVSSGPLDAVGITAARIDGDGRPDITFTDDLDSSSHKVYVMRNKGSRHFADAQGYDVGAAPADVAVARLDKDDRPDLAVANADDGTVSILHGQP